jgi:HSP20 family molecular chaperone IbpA
MAKTKTNIERIELEKLRRLWLPEEGKYYFSVVDVIGLLTESTDARNYWKVLKNRLKNTQNKLVTECNQLKMKAADGKSYLTDTASTDTLLAIIKLVSPENLATFKLYFQHIENSKKESYPQGSRAELTTLQANKNIEDEETENELLIDGYQTEDSIFIQTLVAGVSEENISVSVSSTNLIIKGSREEKNKTEKKFENEYLLEELLWGKFSRSIPLPADIEVASVTATLSHGLLTIKMKKIDKEVVRKVEVKTI